MDTKQRAQLVRAMRIEMKGSGYARPPVGRMGRAVNKPRMGLYRDVANQITSDADAAAKLVRSTRSGQLRHSRLSRHQRSLHDWYDDDQYHSGYFTARRRLRNAPRPRIEFSPPDSPSSPVDPYALARRRPRRRD